ncbi:hypothetical protein [Aquimarina litoralis]|uniref:hypothetical protein n=1 Tax=Aquimarina litoralis TaxID=584605 RepID=UPI001C56DF5E|nr:hypothetical protein [Aquimarina litoralis]MBW1297819.1 hypothetical protein [Aquimarina litoralis]
MANIFRKYGVWEYVLFLFGVFILVKLGKGFWNDTIENTVVNFFAFVAAILCIAAPATLVDTAKSKAKSLKDSARKIRTKPSKNGTNE